MIKKSMNTAMDFFDEMKRRDEMVVEFVDRHQLSIYELQLLTIIYKHQEILLRTIIQKKLMKNNQINKAVKLLYDEKLINKQRLPMDERTVLLSIKDEKIKDVEKMIKDFAEIIRRNTYSVVDVIDN